MSALTIRFGRSVLREVAGQSRLNGLVSLLLLLPFGSVVLQDVEKVVG